MSVLRREREKEKKSKNEKEKILSRWKRNGTEVVGQKTDNGLVRRGGLGGIRNIKCDTKTEFILFYESLGGPWIVILWATAQILCWV